MSNKITFVCGGKLVPSSRFRVHPIEEALCERGWDTEIIHGYGIRDQQITGSITKRGYRAICRIRRAVCTSLLDRKGPVFVQRLALPWWGMPETILAKRNGGLIFDFDDAVFLGNSGTKNAFRRRALDSVFKHSSHVVAGNSWLAGHVTSDVPISVIPTCINTEYYVPANRAEREERLRIGWIGTSSNFPNLWQLERPLAQLRSLGFSFDFVICSDSVDSTLFRKLDARYEKWTPQGELNFLQSLDIGLMPLSDTDWSRGKCSFKMIQYMSVGCPTVASAVGMNMDVLENDVGGRLVYDEDWVGPIAELIESTETRYQVSQQARARAVTRYDIRVAIEQYAAIFTGLQDC